MSSSRPSGDGTIGVISHLSNPTAADMRGLANAAEAAGADWLGVPDAFWWRDTWLLVAEAARATSRLWVGPMLTNPFLRHPFHTVAALATVQELAGPRVHLGIGAGGSEVSGAARTSRAGAPRRIEDLAHLVRSVAAGGPLDEPSGRRLEVPLEPAPITIAGRGDGVLRAAGRSADRVLLWAIPGTDLDRSVEVVRSTAADRDQSTMAPEPMLVWAPLVVHAPADRERARAIAAYGVVNAHPDLRDRWGIDDDATEAIRGALVGGGAAAAADRVPDHVIDDIADPDPDPARHAETATRIGARSMAVPAHDIASVETAVAWAATVLDTAHR